MSLGVWWSETLVFVLCFFSSKGPYLSHGRGPHGGWIVGSDVVHVYVRVCLPWYYCAQGVYPVLWQLCRSLTDWATLCSVDGQVCIPYISLLYYVQGMEGRSVFIYRGGLLLLCLLRFGWERDNPYNCA